MVQHTTSYQKYLINYHSSPRDHETAFVATINDETLESVNRQKFVVVVIVVVKILTGNYKHGCALKYRLATTNTVVR